MLFDVPHVILNHEFILKAGLKDGTFFFHFSSNKIFLSLYGTLAESLNFAFALLIFPCFLNAGFPACCTSCLLGKSNYYLSAV